MTNCSFQNCHHSHPMQYTPDQLAAIQEFMQPGMNCIAGFVAKDVENVQDLYLDDKTKLERIGFTHFQLGRALELLTNSAIDASKALNSTNSHNFKKIPVVVGDLSIIVNENEDDNEMTCPFDLEQTQCHKGKRTFEIINIKTMEQLNIAALAIDLLRDHAFCEGKSTGYRIEPEVAVRVLTPDLITQLTADL